MSHRCSSYAADQAPTTRLPFARPLTLALHFILFSGALALGFHTPEALAQQIATTQAIRSYDIPAGPLSKVLTRFSNEAVIQVGATELAEGKQAPALEGMYTVEQALQYLLAGTGLTYRFSDSATVTLAKAAAQEPTGAMGAQMLDQVVVSASRTKTPASELTQSVTVVGRQEVEKQAQIDRSPSEILAKTVPGFSPSNEANTNFGQTLRGRTFLTLIDGVPQTTPLRDGRRSLNSIDPDAIERIEVVRGGTAAYGFGAQGGLVNIVTKRPEEGAFNVEASGGTGFSATHPDDSFDGSGSLGVSGRKERFDYLAKGTFVHRGGRFDADGDRIPPNPLGGQGGFADTDTWNFLGKVGFEIDKHQRVQVTGMYYDLEQDTDYAGISFEGDPDTNRKTPAVKGDAPVNPGTENRNVNMEYTHDDLWGSSVSAQGYYAELDVIFGKFPGFQQTQIVSEKVGGRLTIETPVALEALPFTLTWGLDVLDDTTSQTGKGTGISVAAPELEQIAYAGFAQVEVPIAERVLLSGGIRHEIIDVDAPEFLQTSGNLVEGGTIEYDETVFNISGTVFLTDWLDVYGGFSQSFNITELGRVLRTFPFSRAEQAESEAETVDNYELGIKIHRDRWDATIVGFFSESDGGTTFNQDLDIVKAAEEIWGVELAANFQAMENLRLGGTFTWMDGQVDLDDDGDFDEDLPTTRIPPAKLTGYAEYSPLDWWQTRLQALYSADRNVDSTQFGGTSDIDDYTLVDLYNSFEVGPGRLQIGVENLFNNEYTPVLNQAYDLSFAVSRGPGARITADYKIKF